MVASLVGMAQQPGISSAVGEPVEPTNKLWEKKMYPGAKKVSIFSENPLTSRILPVQSLVTGHWSLVTGHWSLVTGHWSLVTGHAIIVFTEQIPFPIQARPQAEFPSAASLRLNRFFPVIIPAACWVEIKFVKGVFK